MILAGERQLGQSQCPEDRLSAAYRSGDFGRPVLTGTRRTPAPEIIELIPESSRERSQEWFPCLLVNLGIRRSILNVLEEPDRYESRFDLFVGQESFGEVEDSGYLVRLAPGQFRSQMPNEVPDFDIGEGITLIPRRLK